MRQLTYVRPNLLEWWDVPEPRLQDDRDAIVAPLAVTRCDLDLAIAIGKAGFAGPFAIGHEAAGIVTAVGDAVTNFAPGDQVIVPFQISCGQCDRCRRGYTNACTSVPFRSSYGLKPVCGTEFGGALSDFLRVPFADHMLVRQPTGHALSQTASLADAATAGFSAVKPWLERDPGAAVLVIGGWAQSLGLLAAEAALALGAKRVVYLDDDARRLGLAKALGAEVHQAEPGPDVQPIGVFPIVIDAACTTASLHLALRSVEPCGVCQRLYGDFSETTPVLLRHMYGIGITLAVGRVQARADLPECLDHVTAGHLHPERFLTLRARFEDAHEAIKDPTIKVVFLRDGIE
jgi:threonine dehydrogenase-like Zn-dependent dehydrogenase